MRNMLFFAVLTLLLLTVSAKAVLVIDDFLTTQSISPFGSVTGSDMIGGERDAARYHGIMANVNQTVPGQLHYQCGINDREASASYMILVYDGVDGGYDNNNYDGLGHVDLTDSGTSNGFVFNFSQMPSSYHYLGIWIMLNQGTDRPTNYGSQGTKQGYIYTRVTGGPQEVFVAFDDFTALDPFAIEPSPEEPLTTLIDFADVGYIRVVMFIGLCEETYALDSITTGYAVVPEPASAMLMLLGAVCAGIQRRR